MESRSKILVTGANGLLGMNTVLELLNQGFLVKAFVRDPKNCLRINHDNLEYFVGDITTVENLEKAMIESQFVIHIAALVDPKLVDYEVFHRVNVQATKYVVEAAIKCKVKKLIYVSTSNVFGYGSIDDLGNELKPMMAPFNKMHYAISKFHAQQYVLSKSDLLEVTVVNPTFMIGAYDSKPSSGRIIQNCLYNRLVLCPSGGKNFICVKDVSRGIVNAMQFGLTGECYVLANENLSFYEFYKKVRSHVKTSFRIVKLPNWLLHAIGYVGSLIRLLRIKTSISIENVRTLSVNNYYSNDKARAELFMKFTPIDEGIHDAVVWFERKNKVDK
ncbi:NAD-dependent epimerase/dehydratase family protein [Aestuariivivens marinum]|uniref:NAD-dependent epimerase/dehydratase family protein n=1 Tax=Aestuariivivens marinum TaxID=2913555 RepID=UPI001F561176|nr:NAD-dependent epimerase/dehydratase family protein [Aestuariivivens marinum]